MNSQAAYNTRSLSFCVAKCSKTKNKPGGGKPVPFRRHIGSHPNGHTSWTCYLLGRRLNARLSPEKLPYAACVILAVLCFQKFFANCFTPGWFWFCFTTLLTHETRRCSLICLSFARLTYCTVWHLEKSSKETTSDWKIKISLQITRCDIKKDLKPEKLHHGSVVQKMRQLNRTPTGTVHISQRWM